MLPKNRQFVKDLVINDLKLKMEQGWTVERIKAMSLYSIESYCLEFRLEHGHKAIRGFKDGTVNRYVEQFIKAKTVTTPTI